MYFLFVCLCDYCNTVFLQHRQCFDCVCRVYFLAVTAAIALLFLYAWWWLYYNDVSNHIFVFGWKCVHHGCVYAIVKSALKKWQIYFFVIQCASLFTVFVCGGLWRCLRLYWLTMSTGILCESVCLAARSNVVLVFRQTEKVAAACGLKAEVLPLLSLTHTHTIWAVAK